MIIQKVKIAQVKLNESNPRIIKDEKFRKLVQSIKDFPQMLDIRPVVVNENMVVLGGNMRFKACIEAGLKEVPIIKASELTEEQQKEFIIKDNVGFGEWDWDILANEWDSEQLTEWGLDLLSFNENDLSNNNDMSHLSQPNHLKKWLENSLKQMKLTFEENNFEKVVNWFSKKQLDFNLDNNSDVILKIIQLDENN